MRTIEIVVLSISIMIAGCGPVMLRVETPGIDAHLRTQVVKGDEPTEPSDCATPCQIALHRGTEHQLNIDAPGYYPASFKISYDNARIIDKKGEDVLRVPLLHRPAVSVASQPTP